MTNWQRRNDNFPVGMFFRLTLADKCPKVTELLENNSAVIYLRNISVCTNIEHQKYLQYQYLVGFCWRKYYTHYLSFVN